MKRFTTWLLTGCILLLFAAGCGFLDKVTEDPFVGKWIGIISLPGVKESVVRLTIDPADGTGRYRIYAIADQYNAVHPKTSESSVYLW